MEIAVPDLKYTAQIPERVRIFIQELYETVWGDDALLAVGTKQGQMHIISVNDTYSEAKYRIHINKPQDRKIFFNLSDRELIQSGWTLIYTSQHDFSLDFSYPLKDYLQLTADTIARQIRKMGTHFDVVSMHLLGDIFYQAVALAMSKATGSICECARYYTNSQILQVLDNKLKPYEVRILQMYSEYPQCGIPISDKQYQELFTKLSDMVREITYVED